MINMPENILFLRKSFNLHRIVLCLRKAIQMLLKTLKRFYICSNSAKFNSLMLKEVCNKKYEFAR